MKNILITGGSRGIGRAIVELFSKKGYKVSFTYKSSEKEAEELASATDALAIRADSAVPEDINAAVKAAEEKLGEIDILVNNAAISSFSLIQDITPEAWGEMISVNLTAPFLYSQAVLPSMIKNRHGRIINISSMWGLVGASCEVHYSAAKAGLIGMTRAMAKELAPSGITVNAVAPGVIATEMNKRLSKEELSALEDETPIGRLGSPEEVAEAVLYLAGAGFVTGEVLNISGGFVI